jgi:hypothetical protein
MVFEIIDRQDQNDLKMMLVRLCRMKEQIHRYHLYLMDEIDLILIMELFAAVVGDFLDRENYIIPLQVMHH